MPKQTIDLFQDVFSGNIHYETDMRVLASPKPVYNLKLIFPEYRNNHQKPKNSGKTKSNSAQ